MRISLYDQEGNLKVYNLDLLTEEFLNSEHWKRLVATDAEYRLSMKDDTHTDTES